jgi:hypothetical protein
MLNAFYQYIAPENASPCPLNTKELRLPFSCAFGNGVCVLQVNPLVPLHIQKEILVLEFMLRRALDHMEVNYSFIEGPLDLRSVRYMQKGGWDIMGLH